MVKLAVHILNGYECIFNIYVLKEYAFFMVVLTPYER